MRISRASLLSSSLTLLSLSCPSHSASSFSLSRCFSPSVLLCLWFSGCQSENGGICDCAHLSSAPLPSLSFFLVPSLLIFFDLFFPHILLLLYPSPFFLSLFSFLRFSIRKRRNFRLHAPLFWPACSRLSLRTRERPRFHSKSLRLERENKEREQPGREGEGTWREKDTGRGHSPNFN